MADGTGNWHAPGEYIQGITSDIDLYAIWGTGQPQAYTVTVDGGGSTGSSGSGQYQVGATVNIYAGTYANYTFVGWTVVSGGITLADASNAYTSFTMPANAVTVTANWTELPPTWKVTVYNGTGGGSHPAGATVTINAYRSSAGRPFKEWIITPDVTFTGGTDRYSATATFTMPASSVTVTAIYEHPFTITTTDASLPEAKTGEPYTATLAASGDSGTATWTVTSGDLPPGLTLSSAGVISGTPTTAGSWTFTVTAASGTSTVTKTFTMTVSIGAGVSNEAVTALTLSVYPNPTSGELHLKGYYPALGNLYLIDAPGRLTAVYAPAQLTFGETCVINISHLPAGIYYLKTGDKVVKIILQ
jgi:uncharacterized repeat protein (TIGR02543 family)